MSKITALKLSLSAELPHEQLGMRLDQALAEQFTQYSRTRIKDWIINGHVTVNGHVVDKPKERILGGELIEINTEIEEENNHIAQDIALNIVYEDDDILVINKPRDLVVHPGAGNPNGTILNALLHHYPESANIPRAGIVHRLDKDTTGLMVIAKSIEAQTGLVESLQHREITREYEAVAMGIITAGGSVDEPISRHPTKRTHMSVFPTGKPAVTHYRIMEKYRLHTRLRLRLETGRTHQIRVHMAHIAHPLVGDPLYGGRPRPPRGASEEFMQVLRDFDRQALHATMLRLYHPITGVQMEWHAPIPEDMQKLVQVMQEDAEQYKDQIDW
ncbi:23S rRNA pseudouridine(1911/1915/1917) synthase RluD [Orbaceae bacterium ac157xtp]